MILQILMYSLGQSANYSVSAPNPSWVCSVILGLEFCRPHLSLPEAVVLCRCGAPEGSWNTGGEKRPCSSLFCCCTCQLQLSNCSSPQLWKLVPASFFFSPALPEQPYGMLLEKAAAARQCAQRSGSRLSVSLLGASRFSSYCSFSLRSHTLASCKCYHLVASESPIQFFSSLSPIYPISCIKFCQQPDSYSFSD